MPFLLATVLALDQRIELQLPLLLSLTIIAARQQPAAWRADGAVIALVAAAAYLLLNSLVTFIDPNGISSNWWAAPVRVWLYYVMLIAMATVMASRHLEGDRLFQILEWLFVFKVIVVAFEGYALWQTGEPRQRPLFNIILDADTLFGVRFTSSYDFLFALLVLSPRHLMRRLALIAGLLLISETRTLLLLALLLFTWRLWRARSPWLVITAFAIPVALAGTAAFWQMGPGDTSPRLFQYSGSSLDDKLEQVEAVNELLWSPHLLTGRGMGVSMPGIVRDELRPYSYEAQVPVLMWQGGLLFFVVHISIVFAYVRRHRFAAILLVLGLGVLNPTLFSLASAFFLTALGKAVDRPHERRQNPIRNPRLHAQRPSPS